MIHIPVWSIFVIISILVVWKACSMEARSGWDFYTPMVSVGMILFVIIFWVAWGLSKLF